MVPCLCWHSSPTTPYTHTISIAVNCSARCCDRGTFRGEVSTLIKDRSLEVTVINLEPRHFERAVLIRSINLNERNPDVKFLIGRLVKWASIQGM
jgi:hypothetical protein